MGNAIIVTGGAGFIGSHLVDALLARGEEVVVIDRFLHGKKKKIPGVKYLHTDIRSPYLVDAILRIRPRALVHLAAHIDNLASVKNPMLNADHNIMGSINVFDAMAKAGSGKVVFASSCAVYGDPDPSVLPLTHEAEFAPGTPYGLSKRVGELYLDRYSKLHGLPYTILRKANVFGPRQHFSSECGVIGLFVSRMIQGKPVFIYGDGTSIRDYIHVDDAVSAYLLAIDSEAVGTVNVGTGVGVSTLDVYQAVQKSLGRVDEPAFKTHVKDVTRAMILDPRQAKEVLGWEPVHTFASGVEKTVEWYKRFYNKT